MRPVVQRETRQNPQRQSWESLLCQRKYLLDMLGERQLELMRGIKNVFDPKGILNPGKVI